MDAELPPLEELKTIQQKLIGQIATAEQWFPAETDGLELLTSRAALKCIEEAIEHTGQREVA